MSASVPLQPDNPASPQSPKASDMTTRVMYGTFLVAGFVVGLLLQNDVVEWVVRWAINLNGDCSTTSCVGTQSAYRVSFALFVFFFFHYIISHSMNCCMTADQRVEFNRPKMFFIRVIVLVAVMVISFLIPNGFFVYYAWFAMIVSCFYLIGQLILLLHFSYKWNDSWAQRDDSKYTYALIGVTIALFVGALVAIGFLFKWFGNDSSCQTGQGILCSTLLVAVLYTGLSIWAEHGSLLPSSVVFAYTVWLAYSGLSGGIQAGICNTVNSASYTQMIIGAIVSALSLAIAATNAGGSKEAFEVDATDPTISAVEVAAHSFQFFHLMMMMGSCYLAMLLTSWSVLGAGGIGESPDSGVASMWVKLSSDILCMLLYMWTLVAPSIFKDRNFG